MERTFPRQVFLAYDAAPQSADELCFCPRCAAACASTLVSGRARPRCARCGYVHFRNPAPGVAVVVRQGEHVLLGRRIAQAHRGGWWAFPAGFIEFDEDFLTAARREAREETGLEVTVTGILNVTTNYLTHNLHALVVAVSAEPSGGALSAGDDFCEVRWVALGGALPPLAYEADANLLQALQTGSVGFLPVDGRAAVPLP